MPGRNNEQALRLGGTEADHIVPWHKGGKTVIENHRKLCKLDSRTNGGKSPRASHTMSRSLTANRKFVGEGSDQGGSQAQDWFEAHADDLADTGGVATSRVCNTVARNRFAP